MKVVVKKEFRDVSDFNLVHHVGEVLEVDEARANRLVSLGLVTIEGEGGGEGGGGSIPDMSGMVRVRGALTLAPGQSLADALASIPNPSVGDVYLYWNTDKDLTEEYVYVEHEETVTVNGTTTTHMVGQWQLLGIKQNTLNMKAENIKDSNNLPTNKYKIQFHNKK